MGRAGICLVRLCSTPSQRADESGGARPPRPWPSPTKQHTGERGPALWVGSMVHRIALNRIERRPAARARNKINKSIDADHSSTIFGASTRVTPLGNVPEAREFLANTCMSAMHRRAPARRLRRQERAKKDDAFPPKPRAPTTTTDHRAAAATSTRPTYKTQPTRRSLLGPGIDSSLRAS